MCLKTLSHFENGRDVTAYSMSGKVKTRGLVSVRVEIHARLKRTQLQRRPVYNEETRYMASRPYFK